MSNATTTARFFKVTDKRIKAEILANIAAHYGITAEEAEAEVTHPEAEHLLDYVTGPTREATSMIMKRRGFL